MDHREIADIVAQIKLIDEVLNHETEAETPPFSITVINHERTRIQNNIDRKLQLKNRMMTLYVDLKCKIIAHPDRQYLAGCFNEALGSEIIKL